MIGVPRRVREGRLHADELMPVVEVVFSDFSERIAALLSVVRFDREDIQHSRRPEFFVTLWKDDVNLGLSGLVVARNAMWQSTVARSRGCRNDCRSVTNHSSHPIKRRHSGGTR